MAQQIKRASGAALTQIGEAWGIRRRWCGFEPDLYYRPRVLQAIKESVR